MGCCLILGVGRMEVEGLAGGNNCGVGRCNMCCILFILLIYVYVVGGNRGALGLQGENEACGMTCWLRLMLGWWW